jgi:hypothetical protein
MDLQNSKADSFLFSLGKFDDLKNRDISWQEIKNTGDQDKTVTFQKQKVELNVEKNRTLTYLAESFGFHTDKPFTKSGFPETYRMFEILEQSFQHPQDCRDFRRYLQRLNVLRGKDEVVQKSKETSLEHPAGEHTKEENLTTSLQGKETIVDTDTKNKIYTFLKEKNLILNP